MHYDQTSFRTLVVGTDFSESARNAFRYTQHLAETSNARIDVVHVIEPLGHNPLVEAFRSAVDEAEVVRRLLGESESRMQEFVSGHDIPSSRLRCIHARSNDVARTLVQYADTLEADVLVVGTRGHGALGKALLGGTASHVVEIAASPVLVVPLGAEEHIQHQAVLAPIDLSGTSSACLEEAHKLARLLHGHLHVLHVLQPYALPVSLTGIRSIRDLVPDIVERVTAELQATLQGLEELTVPYSVRVREGHAPSEIIDMAREIDAGVIVMARRGFSKGDRFLVGGVAERVFGHAPCPVYVMPVPTLSVEANGMGAYATKNVS